MPLPVIAINAIVNDLIQGDNVQGSYICEPIKCIIVLMHNSLQFGCFEAASS